MDLDLDTVDEHNEFGMFEKILCYIQSIEINGGEVESMA